MKILIVDDVQYCLLLLEKILVSMGHTVVKSETPQEAIKQLEKQDDINMVITDYSMPEYDGVYLRRACQSLYSNKVGISPPAFVMISAHLNESLENQLRQEGFLDIIGKPCSKDRIESLFMAISA